MPNWKPKFCVCCGKKFLLNSPAKKYCLECKLDQYAIVKSKNNVFRAMMDRCHNKNSKDYGWYGARGITVCPEWRGKFEIFKQWATDNGFKIGLDLDRKDTNKGYSPNNCHFVTRKVNQNNRRNKMTFENGRICSVCRILKPFDQYHSGSRATCKECRNITRRKDYVGMEK